MTDPRPAPPVTVTGGPGAARARVLLDEAPADDGPSRPVRRRRTPLVAAGLALLAVLVVAELRERAAAEEAARAEAERARSAVDLDVVVEESGSTAYVPELDSVSFAAVLRVRNAGSRTVTITALDLPGVELLGSHTVEAGRERRLTLAGQRPCGDDLASLLDLDRLPLEVRTDAGQQSVDLALDGPLLFGDAVRRACGITRPGLS